MYIGERSVALHATLVPKKGVPSCFNGHPYQLLCPSFSFADTFIFTQPLWYVSRIQIIYEVQEGVAEVHPWLSPTLVEGCPLVIAGTSSDLKCALAQLKEVDGT